MARALPDRTVSPHGHASQHLTAETGTYRWMAPEVIKHEPYSASADVYSFAMVLFELITHHAPFAEFSALQAAAAAGLEDKRPALPPDTPKLMLDLICRAWASCRTARPPAAQLLRELQSMPGLLPAADLYWLDTPFGHPCIRPPEPPAPSFAGHSSQRMSEALWQSICRPALQAPFALCEAVARCAGELQATRGPKLSEL